MLVSERMEVRDKKATTHNMKFWYQQVSKSCHWLEHLVCMVKLNISSYIFFFLASFYRLFVNMMGWNCTLKVASIILIIKEFIGIFIFFI